MTNVGDTVVSGSVADTSGSSGGIVAAAGASGSAATRLIAVRDPAEVPAMSRSRSLGLLPNDTAVKPQPFDVSCAWEKLDYFFFLPSYPLSDFVNY